MSASRSMKIQVLLMALLVSAAALAVMVGAWAQSLTAPALIPATGGAAQTTGRLTAHEYALVEQSVDNPTHLSFQERAVAAVAAQRFGWRASSAQSTQAANRALQSFGFRLQANQAPPFSGYTLYRFETALRSDIARAGAVMLNIDPTTRRRAFLLPFVTLTGEQYTASAAGVYPQASGGNALDSTSGSASISAPKFAYAQTSGGAASAPVEPQAALAAFTDFAPAPTGAAPFFFTEQNGQVYLNLAGQSLPNRYDRVITQNQGELSVFNPGASGSVIWFYALRDGLWYYVEAGLAD